MKKLIVLLLIGWSSGSLAQINFDGHWKQLFNQKDLTGWDVKIKGYDLNDNFGNTFRVEDGVLKVCYDEYDDFGNRFGHLFYQKEFSHYLLRAEYRFVGEQAPNGPDWAFRNNGLMVHGQTAASMGKHQDFPISIEVQLLGGRNDGQERPTCNLCTPGSTIEINGKIEKRHCINATSPTYHGDQWVTAEVLVLGDSIIKHIVNGDTVLVYQNPKMGGGAVSGYDESLYVEGKSMRKGTISIQAESHPVEFRKIEILDLSDQFPPEPDLSTMIGQMIMTGARGMTIEEMSASFKQQVSEGKTGGIILFDYDVLQKKAHRNIQSPEQVKELIADLQAIAPTPLFMAIDQEGGRVNRLKPQYGFPASVSAQYLGDLNRLDTTRFYAKRTSETLHELGFNVNFAPAVDVNINPESPAIGKIERSYSSDPAMVIRHARLLIEAQSANGILSTLKHFPGHGSAQADSHYGITNITEYWQEKELIPFEQLGQMDNVAIMTAHVVNQNLDANLPATLSQKIITGILREKLGFEGIIFSDDLHMQAVNDQFEFETLLEKSINAGVDILVYGNNLGYDEMIPTKVINTITRLVQEGKISEDRIRQSYNRIMQVKRKNLSAPH